MSEKKHEPPALLRVIDTTKDDDEISLDVPENASQLSVQPEIIVEAIENHLDRETQRETQIQDFENQWRSCCWTVDKRMVSYATKMGFAGCVMIFSAIQLAIGNSPSIYSPLLSFTLGLVFPSPSLTHE